MFSCSYILVDAYAILFECTYCTSEKVEFIFHHVIGFVGGILCLANGRFNIPLSVACLVSEISNFFMNIRWLMLIHKCSDHFLFDPTCVLFAVFFFITRPVGMGMILVRLFEMHTKFDINADGSFGYSM